MSTSLVTGGAGFLGSHLCDYLLAQGRRVICVDNLETGSARNVEHNLGRDGFAFVRHDVVEPLALAGDVDDLVRGLVLLAATRSSASSTARRGRRSRPSRSPSGRCSSR